MRNSLAVIFILTLLGLVPMQASAYLSPEQVFGGTSGSAQPAPPTARDASGVVDIQQQLSAERRAAEQSSAMALQHPAASVASSSLSSVDDGNEPLNLFDDNTQYEKRMERIEENQANGPTIIIQQGNGTVTDSSGRVLHSGAPYVSRTGPESIVALSAMAFAGMATIAIATVRRRKHLLEL